MTDTRDPLAFFDSDPLHFAAGNGDLEVVKTLVAAGEDVNRFDYLGNTPLTYACEEEHLEVVRFLLSCGADVNAHDESRIGETALGQVAGSCSLALAKILIDAGADPTIPGWMQIRAVDRSAERKRGDGPKVHALLVKAAERFSTFIRRP